MRSNNHLTYMTITRHFRHIPVLSVVDFRVVVFRVVGSVDVVILTVVVDLWGFVVVSLLES